MKKNKILIIFFVVSVIIVVIAMITGKQDKNKEATKEKIAIYLEEIEFNELTKEYKDGITTIRANVYNNTDKNRSINVKIILKDHNGVEIKNMIQKIDNIEPGRKKILQTGILGDYSNVNNIEFYVISDEEIEIYNK